MAKRKSGTSTGTSRARHTHDPRSVPALRRAWPRTLLDGLIHSAEPEQPRWKLVPLVLALAFAVRAAVALAGDFVLHPDEIMQYLEPAHRLAFGNGVVYWEYFYGARSWLVPGVVAGALKLFDAAGLGEPLWYVGGVKLLFCAISLAIPAGMYSFARRHFSETAARLALLAGAFWYELAGFAHKPLTEFVATAPLLGLLALCASPSPDRPRVVWQAAALAVLVAAIRLQYAPVALVLLAVVFLRTRLKLLLALSAAAACCAVGIFDALAWDGGLFHSYVTNVRFNLILGELRTAESPAYQFLWWLTLAGGGLSVLCLTAALRWPARYGLLLGLIVLVLLAHSVQAHKEYRFIFAVIPLWLLIGADLTARAAAWIAARPPARPGAQRWATGAAGALFAAVSLAGVLNALPAHRARRGVDRGTAAGAPRRATLGDRGGRRPVRRGVAGRRAERSARAGPRVSGLVTGDRGHRLRARPGTDLRRLPLSGARPRRRGGVAGGSPLLQPARLLLPAPRDSVLRRAYGARHQPESGDGRRLGQPPGGRGPRPGRARLLAGARLRPRAHPAP